MQPSAGLRRISFLAVGVVCGCAVWANRPVPTAIAPSPSATSTYWNAGAEFPARLAGFDRGQITQFDPYGDAVRVGYTHLNLGIAAVLSIESVWWRHPEDSLAVRLATATSNLLRDNPASTRVSAGPVQVTPSGEARSGQRVVFTYLDRHDPQHRPLQAELYMFTDSARLISCTATYTADLRAMAEPAVRALLEEWQWPTRPSPICPPAGVTYTLQREQTVILVLQDRWGAVLDTLVNERQAPGLHTVDLPQMMGPKLGTLASGIYVVAIHGVDGTVYRRLALVR